MSILRSNFVEEASTAKSLASLLSLEMILIILVIMDSFSVLSQINISYNLEIERI